MKRFTWLAVLLTLSTPALVIDAQAADSGPAPANARQDARIQLATDLFKAWSSGNADAPKPYLADDAVLEDIVGGKFEGWPAIRKFFADGVTKWPDLKLVPTQFWVSEDGEPLAGP